MRSVTRSSDVAVIADRTAYDVRYTGKLSNRFSLQVDERLVHTIRFNGYRVYERTQTQPTQAWLTKVHEVSA